MVLVVSVVAFVVTVVVDVASVVVDVPPPIDSQIKRIIVGPISSNHNPMLLKLKLMLAKLPVWL